MKKTIAFLLVVVMLLGGVALCVYAEPVFMIYRLTRDFEESGIEGLDPYLTDKLQPMYQTVLSVYKNPWVQNLLENEKLMSFLSATELGEELNWELKDIQRGRKTATVLVAVDGETFGAQMGLELVCQEGKWLIDGITFPKLEFNKKAHAK